MIDLMRYTLTDRPPLRERRRYARGERHGRSKLTDAQRDAIPGLLRGGHTCRDLARKWGVGHSTISRYSGGSFSARGKLRAEDMPLILELRESMTLAEIGEKFEVHGSTVQKAIRRWLINEARRQEE